ncbi:MAG: CotH kinase family protein [Cyclobacteriaceae bacterium]|nr:CotH kinase family protein [Cyclobacteriaceae bacterium]
MRFSDRITIIALLFLCAVQTSFAQSLKSNLPIIVINTNGQTISDEPKIAATMGVIDNGPGNPNSATDPFNNYSGKIGIEIRGSSSQSFPKKQFGIELRDDLGEGVSASLLGMPPEEDWVLFAPYNDKSLMRDALAYKLGRELGEYAPRTRFCEVIINDTYQGVYVLIEKIKRDKNRVDINKLNPDENTGDNLTGGYIIKIDKSTGSDNGGWTSTYTPPGRNGNQTIFFQYDYPKNSDITSQQKSYIQQFIANFEGTLAGTNFTDPVQGYSRYIDVNSFVDFFIVNEVSKNVDGYRLSTYLHKQKDSDGGKLRMGPVWDFNLGFGNANYCTQGNPEGWVTNFNTICPQDFWLIPFWWSRLYQDGNYRSELAARWASLRSNEFATSKIIAYIDSVYNVLNTVLPGEASSAQQRNFQTWPVLGKYIWPNYYVGSSYVDEVNWLKSWVTNRMDWLDLNMPSVITEVKEINENKRVEAFPNPFRKEISFEYTLKDAGTVEIKLFNLLGQMILTDHESHSEAGTYRRTIRTENLPEGSYYYQAILGTEFTSGKVIKWE